MVACHVKELLALGYYSICIISEVIFLIHKQQKPDFWEYFEFSDKISLYQLGYRSKM